MFSCLAPRPPQKPKRHARMSYLFRRPRGGVLDTPGCVAPPEHPAARDVILVTRPTHLGQADARVRDVAGAGADDSVSLARGEPTLHLDDAMLVVGEGDVDRHVLQVDRQGAARAC